MDESGLSDQLYRSIRSGNSYLPRNVRGQFMDWYIDNAKAFSKEAIDNTTETARRLRDEEEDSNPHFREIMIAYIGLITNTASSGKNDLAQNKFDFRNLQVLAAKSVDGWTKEEFYRLFKKFSEEDVEIIQEAVLNKQFLWPEKAQALFVDWARDKKDCVSNELFETESFNDTSKIFGDDGPVRSDEQKDISDSSVWMISGIKVIEVDDLLPPGEQEDMGLPGLSRKPSGEESQMRVQPRIEWLVKALQENGFAESDIKIYAERKIEGRNPKVNPYIVVEAKDSDRHFQVAVCQTVGHATFIIRTPFDPTDTSNVVKVSDLRNRNDVYAIRCYRADQWTNGVIHYASMPMEKLGHQLKTKIGWGDKKDALLDSLLDFYTEFGQLPMASDGEIVRHGSEDNSLIERTTWKRAAVALNLGAIPGLEGRKNFREALESAYGPIELAARRKMRVVRNAEEAAPPPPSPPIIVDARAIFHDAAKGIESERMVSPLLAGVSTEELARAFLGKNRDSSGRMLYLRNFWKVLRAVTSFWPLPGWLNFVMVGWCCRLPMPFVF